MNAQMLLQNLQSNTRIKYKLKYNNSVTKKNLIKIIKNNNLLNNACGDGFELCEHEHNMLSHEVMGKKNTLCITGLSYDMINMVHNV